MNKEIQRILKESPGLGPQGTLNQAVGPGVFHVKMRTKAICGFQPVFLLGSQLAAASNFFEVYSATGVIETTKDTRSIDKVNVREMKPRKPVRDCTRPSCQVSTEKTERQTRGKLHHK